MNTVRDSAGGDSRDEFYISLCLLEAMRGLGWTSPNPLVGCVIVRDGAVYARGAHLEDGQAHAERNALLMLSNADDAAAGRITPGCAKGATLYVNLEPCSHHGRTPPCTDAIIAAGVARVVYGDRDSDPRSAARARAVLEAAGIAVTGGVCEDECRRFNDKFHHLHARRYDLTDDRGSAPARAFVAIKIAQSLDGKIALANGESKWITCPESRARVHLLRQAYDAVLIGAETLRKDDPLLTARTDVLAHGGIEIARPRDPIAIVVTKSGVLPANAKLFTEPRAPRAGTGIIVAVPKVVIPSGIPSSAVVLDLPEAADGGIDWLALFEKLPEYGIHSVLVEGGAGVWTSIIRAGAAARKDNHRGAETQERYSLPTCTAPIPGRDACASRDSHCAVDGFPDKYYIFIAPKIIGGDGKSAIDELGVGALDPVSGTLDGATSLKNVRFESIGCDMLITGYGGQ